MRSGHKQFFVLAEHDNKICGEYESSLGNASTIKSAKAIIRNYKSDNGCFTNLHNFRVYDSYADVDEKTNFVPCVYSEC